MTVPMIEENWPLLLEPGLRSIFMVQRDAIIAPSPMGRFYNVATSNKAVEHVLGIGGMSDVPVYNGTIEYDSLSPLYEANFTHVEYVKGIQIERKLLDDDQYNIINERPRGLGIAYARTREKNAASVFNNAFSTSFLGPDGKSLSATDHPYGPNASGTASNKGTTALSYDAVIATRKLMRAFVDDRGELVTVQPNTLVVGPGLQDVAETIINSVNKPGTANNDANIVRGQGWQLVVWDYLTDSNDWFMVDETLAKQFLWWFDRTPLEFAIDPSSGYDLIARYRGYERYSFGWSDWRWIYGQQVA